MNLSVCRTSGLIQILFFYSLNCWAITGGTPVGDNFKNVGFLTTYTQGNYQSEVNLWGFVRDGTGPVKQFYSDRCLATRILKTVLITAAHCLREEDGTKVDGAQVTLENRAFRVDRFVVHDNFRMDPILNFESVMPLYDVALLYSKEMGESELENPVFLLPNQEITHDHVLSAVGRQHYKSIATTTKMHTTFEVQDIFEDVTWKKLNLFDKYTMVSKVSTIRQGDSGGPTFSIENGKIYLVGIHSMVVACKDCQPNWVNIDTSVYRYRDWIEKTIQTITIDQR
jgi:hypothetical protein